jgi:DNA ligase-1
VTNEEYSLAMNKGKPTTKYVDRFAKLRSILEDVGSPIELIPYREVWLLREALEQTQEWMTAGFEGAILKDKSGVFKDGTSKHQLKLKLEISIDVRIVGFKEGRVGTKREQTFGALEYATDDGKIRGFVSGFTDKQLEELNENRTAYIGKIMAVTCNDITKGRDNDYYALSHPRFDEIRNDKDTTDTLERALDTKEMQMNLI